MFFSLNIVVNSAIVPDAAANAGEQEKDNKYGSDVQYVPKNAHVFHSISIPFHFTICLV